MANFSSEGNLKPVRHMQISDILLLLEQKGIHNGKITIPIVNGVLRLDKVEYQVTGWVVKNVDSVSKREK